MSSNSQLDRLLQLGTQVVDHALSRGADVAEVLLNEGAHLSVKVRMGEPEFVEEASSKIIGMRVMRGQQVAIASSSDLSPGGLDRFVDDAIELARLSQPDPFAGPPDSSLLSNPVEYKDLQLFDPEINRIDTEQALRLAEQGESSALDYDSRLTNSEGSTVSRVSGVSSLITSGGFKGTVRGTYVSITVNPIADDKDGKKRSGYYWDSTRHLSDLKSVKQVGEEAARRTLDKLGARKIGTQEVAVIFDPDAGRSILRLLAGCVLGGSIWRQSSYLVGRIGKRIASDLITVVDNPLIAKGPGSRPFDGEGLLSRHNMVVQNGILKSYLLDTYSARKLNSSSTGSAARGAGGSVGASTSNFTLLPGKITPQELISSTDKALYVTDMMGFGFNAVTGDFSRGAAGFWIERGKKSYPVSEVTISLNLDKLLQRIDMVANDLDLRTSTACPTFRVSSMTVAGR